MTRLLFIVGLLGVVSLYCIAKAQDKQNIETLKQRVKTQEGKVDSLARFQESSFDLVSSHRWVFSLFVTLFIAVVCIFLAGSWWYSTRVTSAQIESQIQQRYTEFQQELGENLKKSSVSQI